MDIKSFKIIVVEPNGEKVERHYAVPEKGPPVTEITNMVNLSAEEVSKLAGDALGAMLIDMLALKIALGYHINADAYRDTFPDNEADAKQLSRSETWHRLKARSMISDRLAAECGDAMKAHASAEMPPLKVIQ